ncbi:disrupted in schizophrenia 1 protein-like [Rhynchonycteris naso]
MLLCAPVEMSIESVLHPITCMLTVVGSESPLSPRQRLWAERQAACFVLSVYPNFRVLMSPSASIIFEGKEWNRHSDNYHNSNNNSNYEKSNTITNYHHYLMETRRLLPALLETSVKESAVKYMDILKDRLHSCKCLLLRKVWEADLKACQLLIQSLQPQEAKGSVLAEDEKQMDDLGEAPGISPRPLSEDKRRTPFQTLEEGKVPLAPPLLCAGSEHKEEFYILSADLGEKCKAVGNKLLYLEDQLHMTIHSHDEDLIHILFSLQIKHRQAIL